MIEDVSHEERTLLLEILDEELKQALHGLHHTDSRDYKELLKRRIELIESLLSKFQAADASANG